MTKIISPPMFTKEIEDEDPLEYLTVLFKQVVLDYDYSDYSDSGSEYDSDSVGEPRSKDYYESKYCFSVSNRLHYFDDDRNVYLEDGTLVHNSSLDLLSDDLLAPSFHINGVPYWFGADNNLSSLDESGSICPVHTWQKEPEVFDLIQFLNQPPVPTDDTVVLQSNLSSGSYHDPQIPTILSAPAAHYSTQGTMVEAQDSNINPNLLQQGSDHHGEATMLALSPSSIPESPIVPTGSPTFSEELSLFLPSQPEQAQGILITSVWQQDIKKAQQAAARARPVRKPNKENKWRCTICNKLFHRPGGLEEHRNVHTGEKPHKCPFETCNTGFATKSNLSRHFLTHQVGQLKTYRPGMTYESDPTRPERASRAPIATYNSKAHHNGRFRIVLQEAV